MLKFSLKLRYHPLQVMNNKGPDQTMHSLIWAFDILMQQGQVFSHCDQIKDDDELSLNLISAAVNNHLQI